MGEEGRIIVVLKMPYSDKAIGLRVSNGTLNPMALVIGDWFLYYFII